MAALGTIGDPDVQISSAEADLRIFIHDILHADHDKDVRTLAAFMLDELGDTTLHAWTMDYWGALREIVFVPLLPSLRHVYIVLQRGHARAMAPYDQKGEPPPMLTTATVHHSHGWEHGLSGQQSFRSPRWRTHSRQSVGFGVHAPQELFAASGPRGYVAHAATA